MGEGDDDCGGGVGGEDVYKGRAEPVCCSNHSPEWHS